MSQITRSDALVTVNESLNNARLRLHWDNYDGEIEEREYDVRMTRLLELAQFDLRGGKDPHAVLRAISRGLNAITAQLDID